MGSNFGPKFSISCPWNNDDVQGLFEAIKQLGGSVLKFAHLHEDCTHLLVGRLGKTEKILSALARAIPILDLRSYQEKCLSEKRWILDDELIETFDIGSQPTSNNQAKIPNLETRRLNQGLFKGWRVALFLQDQRKLDTYERVLFEAGADKVIRLSSPFKQSELHNFTHILSEPLMMDTDEHFKTFVASTAAKSPSNSSSQLSTPIKSALNTPVDEQSKKYPAASAPSHKTSSSIFVCSYLIVVESLFRVKISNPKYFVLTSTVIQSLHQSSILFSQDQQQPNLLSHDASLPLSSLNVTLNTTVQDDDPGTDRKRKMTLPSFGPTPKRPKLVEIAAARWQNSPLTPSRTLSIVNYFKPSKQLLVPKLNCSEPIIDKGHDEAVFPIKKSTIGFPRKSESNLMFSTIKPVRLAKTNSAKPTCNQVSEKLKAGEVEISLSQSNSSQLQTKLPKAEIGIDAFRYAIGRVGRQKASQLLNFCPLSKFVRQIELSKIVPGKKRQRTSGPLSDCFTSFFVTYTKNNDENLEEQAKLWFNILEFMQGCVSSTSYLNLSVTHSIMVNGIRDQVCEEVRLRAYSMLRRIIMFQHPPSNLILRNYYLKTFVKSPLVLCDELTVLDPANSWEFFNDLLDNVNELINLDEEMSDKQFLADGHVLLLELVVTILELDFTFAMQEYLSNPEKRGQSHFSMLVRLFWPHNDGAFNNRVRRITDLYLVAFECESPALQMFRRVIKMISTVIALVELPKNTNQNKQAIADYLAFRLKDCDCKTLWLELYLLESEWVSTFVSFNLLSQATPFKSMSLRQLQQTVLTISDDNIVGKASTESFDMDKNIKSYFTNSFKRESSGSFKSESSSSWTSPLKSMKSESSSSSTSPLKSMKSESSSSFTSPLKSMKSESFSSWTSPLKSIISESSSSSTSPLKSIKSESSSSSTSPLKSMKSESSGSSTSPLKSMKSESSSSFTSPLKSMESESSSSSTSPLKSMKSESSGSMKSESYSSSTSPLKSMKSESTNSLKSESSSSKGDSQPEPKMLVKLDHLQLSNSQSGSSVRLVNVNKKNKYGETALHVACRKGNVSRVKEILTSPNVDINSKDNFGWTALHEASSHGRTEVVQLLLDFKPRTIKAYLTQGSRTKEVSVDLWSAAGNANEAEDGEITPLHDAVRHGHCQVADILLGAVAKQGQADLTKMLNLKTTRGYTVFDLTLNPKMIEILTRYHSEGANASSRSVRSNALVAIDISPRKFWIVTHIFFNSYTAMFRLHAMKELMKMAQVLTSSTSLKRRLIFRDFEDQSIQLDKSFKGFLVDRKPLCEAQDIKTFWKLSKDSLSNPVAKVTLKTYF